MKQLFDPELCLELTWSGPNTAAIELYGICDLSILEGFIGHA